MDESWRKVVENEEKIGAYVSNAFRYILLVFFAFQLLANLHTGNAWINGIGISLFTVITVGHSVIIRTCPRWAISVYSYIALVSDFVIISGVLISYTFLASPDNLGFALKNPIQSFFFFPLAFSLVQFRLRLVLLSVMLYYTFYFGFFAYAAYLGKITYAVDWKDYVMGPNLLLADAFTGRPLVYLILAFFFCFGILRTLIMIRRIGEAEAQRSLLSRYFSPGMVTEMMANPDVLTGRRQTATILFTDIRNFTALSENMDPIELGKFLSSIRETLTECVFEFGGTLDKYIGDAVMATFGTPYPSDDPAADAIKALSCGKRMLERLGDFNAKRMANGYPPVSIGIGIHTGEVFSGNIETSQRAEFTVIGDAVNTASRIESLTKNFGKEFLVSEETWKLAGANFNGETLPPIQVKGREKLVTVIAVGI
ncbi:adenylate/guanylate cyclase catalytic domain protein [Leptospira broomii serovar Hurstbridge str. 5399]|uniref:Adenylate/guanylate cyclase catalytic domain protein n=1 Tax=Leptospira broomii serovar Hurstbridge str. 5399 TaxID=1049789 RepID=T0FGN8_9LEPT|nr:adenylate/guanylate cyclase domain-containing protein [Leptospira broomii]EQA46787.1 adenylate/guanylate cyclase catalytic domain protein [Leptospira broomii serovar Hurstbridge str. 5399]